MDESNRSPLIPTVVRDIVIRPKKDGRRSGDNLGLPPNVVEFVLLHETDHPTGSLELESVESIERTLRTECELCAHLCLHSFIYTSGRTVPSQPQSHTTPNLVTTAHKSIDQPEDDSIISLEETRADGVIISLNYLSREKDVFAPNTSIYDRTPHATGQYVKESVVRKTSLLYEASETASLPFKNAKLQSKNENTKDRNIHMSKGRGSRYDTPEESCSSTHCTQRATRKRKSPQSPREDGPTLSPKVLKALRDKVLHLNPQKEHCDGNNNLVSKFPNFGLINAESPLPGSASHQEYTS